MYNLDVVKMEEIETVPSFPKPLPRPRKAKRKKRAPRLPTASQLEATLWRAFSLWIRLRDRHCVLQGRGTCGGPLQAGHLISRRYRSTRYDERNVYSQCAAHNRLHSHDAAPYTLWFLENYGQNAYRDLVARSRRLTKRPTRQEYTALIARYSAPSFA
jgi:hypothetical protein